MSGGVPGAAPQRPGGIPVDRGAARLAGEGPANTSGELLDDCAHGLAFFAEFLPLLRDWRGSGPDFRMDVLARHDELRGIDFAAFRADADRLAEGHQELRDCAARLDAESGIAWRSWWGPAAEAANAQVGELIGAGGVLLDELAEFAGAIRPAVDGLERVVREYARFVLEFGRDLRCAGRTREQVRAAIRRARGDLRSSDLTDAGVREVFAPAQAVEQAERYLLGRGGPPVGIAGAREACERLRWNITEEARQWLDTAFVPELLAKFEQFDRQAGSVREAVRTAYGRLVDAAQLSDPFAGAAISAPSAEDFDRAGPGIVRHRPLRAAGDAAPERFASPGAGAGTPVQGPGGQGGESSPPGRQVLSGPDGERLGPGDVEALLNPESGGTAAVPGSCGSPGGEVVAPGSDARPRSEERPGAGSSGPAATVAASASGIAAGPVGSADGSAGGAVGPVGSADRPGGGADGSDGDLVGDADRGAAGADQSEVDPNGGPAATSAQAAGASSIGEAVRSSITEFVEEIFGTGPDVAQPPTQRAEPHAVPFGGPLPRAGATGLATWSDVERDSERGATGLGSAADPDAALPDERPQVAGPGNRDEHGPFGGPLTPAPGQDGR